MGGAVRGETCPPRQVGRPPPHPRVSKPRRRGEAHGGSPQPTKGWFPSNFSPRALRDRWPHPVDPRDPSSGPGTIPVTLKLSRWPKLDSLYIILYLQTIPELLVTSSISSGTPNNFRVSAY